MKQLIMIALVLVQVVSWAGPRIVFEHTRLDAGKLKASDTYSFVFPFTNKGDTRLVIRQISKTCGCTAPRLSKREFGPGESGEIQVIFFPEGFWGPTRKSVHVISNDPGSSSIRLTMTVDVVAPVVPETGSVLFGDVKSGDTLERRIRLENRTGGAVEPGPIAVDLSGRQRGFMALSGEVDTLANGDMDLIFRLTVPEQLSIPGKQRVTVTVPFPKLEDADLTFQVDVHPAPPVVVEPASLFLGGVDAGDEPIASVHVKSATGESIAVGRPLCMGCPIHFSVEPDDSGGFWIRLFADGESAGKRIQGSIQIPVTLNGKQMIRSVPVSGNIR